MSLESAQAFFVKLQTNREYTDIFHNANRKEWEELIFNEGFDFSDAELQQVISEVDNAESSWKTGGDVWRNSCCTLTRSIRGW